MAEPDRALGSGYRRPVGAFETGAGRNVHVAGRPQLIPVPSLMRSLMSDHLDPGYAAAATQRAGAPETARARVRIRVWGWEALAALLVAAVFAIAVTQARSVAPGVIAEQKALAGSVRSAESTTGKLAGRRAALATQVNELQRRRLTDGTEGRQLLAGLDALSLAAADSPVIGPGVTVTVTEPGVSRNLSDVSKQRVAGSQQIILDRDLQFAVNWLWASGAEAIAVDGVRIGPNVTLRQAGGSILVDNSPISSPYTILAVGPPHSMRDAFDHSPGLFRLRLLENGYGVGVSVSAGDGLALPAGAVRDIKFAKRIGS